MLPLLLLLVFPLALVSAMDPYIPGPHQTYHHMYNSIGNIGLDHQLDIWAPKAQGNFPVVYFLGGLGGLIPALAYTQVLERIASHGYVIAGAWALKPPEYSGLWLDDVITWVEDNLETKLYHAGFPAEFTIDKDNIFLAGHSAGNHVLVGNLKNHCGKVKGEILMSPVDGVDPFGLIDDYVITPGELLCYDTPTLVLTCGLDELPGVNIGDFVPACAPHDLSNKRFYEALAGPTWYVNATAYGHADFLDPAFQAIVQGIHFCATDPGADKDIYRSFAAGSVVAFLSGVYDGDCEAFSYLEDPATMPVQVIVEQKGAGNIACGNPYCTWNGF